MHIIDVDIILNNSDGLDHVKWCEEYGHVVLVCDLVYAESVNIPTWIPVTERLPEKDGMYLVSVSPSSRMEKRVDTDFYSHFGIWQIFGEYVTAWMPLPEPYRKETEGGLKCLTAK